MYLDEIKIIDVGPIENLTINCKIKEDGSPKPVVLVGKNGSGKSIVLAHIVNALLLIKQQFFKNSEVADGFVYKLRSPQYIRLSCLEAFTSVKFSDGSCFTEGMLNQRKNDFAKKHSEHKFIGDWNGVDNDNAFYKLDIEGKDSEAEVLVSKHCCLYFPVNRYEDPAWLNSENLLDNKPKSLSPKNIKGTSNRQIISLCPLRDNQNWIFDTLFDAFFHEKIVYQMNVPGLKGNSDKPQQIPITLTPPNAQSDKYIKFVQEIICKIFHFSDASKLMLNPGTKHNRCLSILNNGKPIVQNIFQMSTGETQVLNISLSILRDYDLTNSPIESIADIKGIVVIDEIDTHMHMSQQAELLPQLIKTFPKIQFIITTHSPFFVLGLDKLLGRDGFNLIDMPSGSKITAAYFSELDEAYKVMKESEDWRKKVQQHFRDDSQPIVYVEGDYDVRYITAAAKHLNKDMVLSQISLLAVGGFSQLSIIWKGFKECASKLPIRLLLLYDCDTKKEDNQIGNLFKRTMPQQDCNPIKKGIENLFSREIISKANKENPQYIDITEETNKIIRGVQSTVPEIWAANRDEKSNLCTWICANGTKEDFDNFSCVFDLIEDILLDKTSSN